jgi:hypothetical protein
MGLWIIPHLRFSAQAQAGATRTPFHFLSNTGATRSLLHGNLRWNAGKPLRI